MLARHPNLRQHLAFPFCALLIGSLLGLAAIADANWRYSQILNCTLTNLAIVGVFYASVLIAGCFLSTLFVPVTLRTYYRRIGKLCLFLTILLVAQCCFSRLWMILVRGRLYRGNPIPIDFGCFDFIPILPFTHAFFDAPHGYGPSLVMGVTLTELNLVWLLFALGTWVVALLSYRFLSRKLFWPAPARECISPGAWMRFQRNRLLWSTFILTLLLTTILCTWHIRPAKSLLSYAVWFVRGQTGTLYGPLSYYGDATAATEYYRHGLREGTWTFYDRNGNILARSEYRHGDPWNGICWIFDRKAWLGEYKNGKPWHGYLPVFDEATRKTEWKYFIQGREVSYDEFCKEWGLKGPGHQFAGLGHFEGT